MAEQYHKNNDDKILLNNKPLKITSMQNYTISKNEQNLSSMIKHEVSESVFDNNCSSSLLKSGNQPAMHPSNMNSSASIASNNTGSNSPKMGSRRIFTPQFKLQVLESYRNDSDCKGNQRATARKYNIHRRQIQKWLQCESNLRSSVASINNSNMKHQFHNVTHEQHLSPHHQQKLAHGSGNHFSHHNINHQQQLAFDSTNRPNVLNNLTAPSVTPMHSAVATSVSSTSPQGALTAANIAAVVAAAAGAMATSSTHTTAVTPIRPTAISGSSIGSPLNLLHTTPQQVLKQHQHYSMSYTHTPVSVPVSSLPMLTHITPQHVRHQYENFSSEHTHTLTHDFMSSYCLPITVLSSSSLSAVPNPSFVSREMESLTDKKPEYYLNEQHRQCLINSTSTPTSPRHYLTNSSESHHCKNEFEKSNIIEHVNGSSYVLQTAPGLLVSPIDLSMGHRHEDPSAFVSTSQAKKTTIAKSVSTLNNVATNTSTTCTSVVDLTFRKRKCLSKEDEPSEKLSKPQETENDTTESRCSEKSVSKPVKLFKPYLLDSEDDERESSSKQKSQIDQFSLRPNHSNSIHKDNYKQEMSQQNFQTQKGDFCTFQAQSLSYTENQSLSPLSDLSPLSISALSPTCFRCPKGSPVSGYESSSSTYSEPSFKNDCFGLSENHTLQVNVKVESTCKSDSIRQTNVQRWLDQESNNLQSTNTSISIYV